MSTIAGAQESGRRELMKRAIIDHLRSLRTPLYAILDSAHAHHCITTLLEKSGCEYCCLYGKRLYEFTDGRGPYLVGIHTENDMIELLVGSAWGRSWGIYLTGAVAFRPLRRHLARMVRVTTDGGNMGLFRFYDPRVLNGYLPGCSTRQVEEFFGPVSSFYLESYDSNELIRFSRAPACGNQGPLSLSRSVLRPESRTVLHKTPLLRKSSF